MSATGGFWPGEAPAVEEEDAQNGEGWPEPHEQEQEAEPVLGETAVAEAAEAEPATEPVEEAEEAEEAAVAPAGHVPGELDIPDDVAVLEGSAFCAQLRVEVVVTRSNREISNKLLDAAP